MTSRAGTMAPSLLSTPSATRIDMRYTRRQIEREVEKMEHASEPWNQPGTIIIPDIVKPELWLTAILIETTTASNRFAELTQCGICGYPMDTRCVSCGIARPQDYPHKMVLPEGGGVMKVPFRHVERKFLVTTQQEWCEAWGTSALCVCGAPMAMSQAQCLLCVDSRLYPER